MTGPEHYTAAEKCLADAADVLLGRGAWHDTPSEARRIIAQQAREEAQVHATLALAAATAMSQPMKRGLDADAWEGVASIWKN